MSAVPHRAAWIKHAYLSGFYETAGACQELSLIFIFFLIGGFGFWFCVVGGSIHLGASIRTGLSPLWGSVHGGVRYR
jgi:hypothetical protein